MRQYNTSTRNTSMKFDWKYSTFLYSLLVSLPAEGGTWKCAVLKNVPNGLIFALFLANHSFTTGCDMLRGTGTLMPGLLSSLVVCSSISLTAPRLSLYQITSLVGLALNLNWQEKRKSFYLILFCRVTLFPCLQLPP